MPEKNPSAVALGSIRTPRKTAAALANLEAYRKRAYQAPAGYITQSEYARRRGISRGRVNQLVKARKIEGLHFVEGRAYIPDGQET